MSSRAVILKYLNVYNKGDAYSPIETSPTHFDLIRRFDRDAIGEEALGLTFLTDYQLGRLLGYNEAVQDEWVRASATQYSYLIASYPTKLVCYSLFDQAAPQEIGISSIVAGIFKESETPTIKSFSQLGFYIKDPEIPKLAVIIGTDDQYVLVVLEMVPSPEGITCYDESQKIIFVRKHEKFDIKVVFQLPLDKEFLQQSMSAYLEKEESWRAILEASAETPDQLPIVLLNPYSLCFYIVCLSDCGGDYSQADWLVACQPEVKVTEHKIAQELELHGGGIQHRQAYLFSLFLKINAKEQKVITCAEVQDELQHPVTFYNWEPKSNSTDPDLPVIPLFDLISHSDSFRYQYYSSKYVYAPYHESQIERCSMSGWNDDPDLYFTINSATLGYPSKFSAGYAQNRDTLYGSYCTYSSKEMYDKKHPATKVLKFLFPVTPDYKYFITFGKVSDNCKFFAGYGSDNILRVWQLSPKPILQAHPTSWYIDLCIASIFSLNISMFLYP